MVLAGRCGTGRRSCVQLISNMMRLEFFTLNITKDYGIREFKKDLKVFFEVATVQNKKTVLFIEDWQIV